MISTHAPLPPAPRVRPALRTRDERAREAWGTASASPRIQGLTSTTARAWAGSRSLAVPVAETPNGLSAIYVPGAAVPAGRTVSFRVWLPTGHRVTALQPFALQGAAGGWRWNGSWIASSTLQVPANAASPLHQLGIEIFAADGWKGTLHLDSVSW
ncbi:MAG: hypothetical protein JXB05_21480 [Myxococcaceae bacterium]|nr:hypothetical protein [Myxococcaceae bacterium]